MNRIQEQFPYARYRDSDSTFQSLEDHLLETEKLAAGFGDDLGYGFFLKLAALFHDVGKSSDLWQEYLWNSVRGKRQIKMDHATAGAQILQKYAGENPDRSTIIGLTAIQSVIMFHHGSGLPDFIAPDGCSEFLNRLKKQDKHIDLDNICENIPVSVWKEINSCFQSEQWKDSEDVFIFKSYINSQKGHVSRKKFFFDVGMHLRNFSSCLIDADRTNSSNFISQEKISRLDVPDWGKMLDCLENYIKKIPQKGMLDSIRDSISERCAELGRQSKGIYTCSAFTGSGKTLASLRFALEQAKQFKMKHVFILAPYTSILDQNADRIRGILESELKKGSVVLECHSSIINNEKEEEFSSESDPDQFEITWNAPIIMTTMVQFLEALFGAGTKKIRRMHQIVNAVLIFDEIQTLPVKVTYLFNWGLDYLVKHCGCTAMLCTATQPSLDKIGEELFHLYFTDEVVKNIDKHFDSFQRVNLIDKTARGRKKSSEYDVCNYVQEQMKVCNSFLVVVNTKSQAKNLFLLFKNSGCSEFVYHLSTNMCPKHRRQVLDDIIEHLKNRDKVICVSTRLIEAGVDISFDGAVRYMAGLDSIIQTAGRCNRNGELTDAEGNKIKGIVAVFSVDNENLGSLEELKIGQRCMERILRESCPEESGVIRINQEIIQRFFQYFYSEIPQELLRYSIAGKDVTILDMLSDNLSAENEFSRITGERWRFPYYKQAFRTAWENFEVISDNMTGILVPYGNNRLAGELYALERQDENFTRSLHVLIQKAQQYSVNVYTGQLEQLKRTDRIFEIFPGIYALHDGFYNSSFGLSLDLVDDSISTLSLY